MQVSRLRIQIILIATLLVVSGHHASAAEWVVFFEDHFSASSLDTGAWNTNLAISGVRWCSASLGGSCDPGQWQDVSAIACSGQVQSPPYGSVTLSEGLIRLSAPSGRCFPYIWKGQPSRTSAFPDTGDFAIEWRAQYSALNRRGTSIRFCHCDNTDPADTANVWCSPDAAALYGGYYGGLILGTRSGGISVPDQLQPHVYRVEYVEGQYSYFIDSVLVATCVDTLRPNAILVGNPVVATPQYWSGFSIDYISVSAREVESPHDAPDCQDGNHVFEVQNYQKISDGHGGLPSNALHDGDAFGNSIASLGDLDGDGVGDVAVSAHADDDGGTNRGAVWVLFLNADGSLKGRHKISSSLGGDLEGLLADHDVFGLGVERLGDLDGDGVPDMVAGAQNDGGTGKGAVWILFLTSDGTVDHYQKINSTVGGFTGTLDDYDYFGNSVALLGDIDGHRVLAVGAPWDDDGGKDRGAVWVLFLNQDGTVDHSQKISSTAGNFGGVLHDEDVFGCEVATVGDLDGDGVCDMAVGAQLDDDGGLDRGAVWIVFLNGDGTVKGCQKISATEGGFTGSLDYYDNFGCDMASLGVVDIDGVVGLAVGASYDDDRASDAGAVWVLFLNRDGTVKGFQKSCDLPGGFTGTLDEGDLFGAGLASLGDINHDGLNDIAVGASRDDDGGQDRGAVWVLFQGRYTTGVPEAAVTQPRLYSSRPNPFNPRTTIRFEIPGAGPVRLAVYDVAGRLIRSLVDADVPAGSHSAVWDGRNEAGQAVASGSYFARLLAGGRVEAVRMSLVR